MIDEKKIDAALSGKLPSGELTQEEKAVWLDRFSYLMGEPGPNEKVFFEKLKAELGE